MKITLKTALALLCLFSIITAKGLNDNKSILEWKTENYLIKVERLDNSYYKYYSWKLPKTMSDTPDLILQDGVYTYKSTDRSDGYRFHSGDYTYLCVKNSNDNKLIVFKEFEKILEESAIDISKKTNKTSSNKKANESVTELPVKQIAFGVVALLLLVLAFIFKKGTLKNYGSIIALLATFFYWVVGFTLNIVFISVVWSAGEAGSKIWLMLLSLLLALVVGILSIIGFFRNVGYGILLLSLIVFSLDVINGAVPGALLAGVAFFGGVLVEFGYRQIDNAKNQIDLNN